MQFRTFALLSIVLLFMPSLAESIPTRVLGPGPISLAGERCRLPESCQFRSEDFGAVVDCETPSQVGLFLRVEGFEDRYTELATNVSEIDLRDESWEPTHVAFELSPIDLAAEATFVWISGARVVLASPDSGGFVVGPRVKPGERVLVAIVGSQVKSTSVSFDRKPSREPVTVALSPGSSTAAVCWGPYDEEPIEECRIQVGVVSPLLNNLGGSDLVRRGEIAQLGALYLIDLPSSPTDSRPLRIAGRDESGNAVLTDLSASLAIQELYLEEPYRLQVEARQASSGDTIRGVDVRLSRDVDGSWLSVSHQETDAGGVARFSVIPGDYRITSEATGHAPNHEEVRVSDHPRSVVVTMDDAHTVEGRVMDSAGSPLPETVVLATRRGVEFEARNNIAMSDMSGEFSVTLPGPGPWELLAQRDKYFSEPVMVSPGTDWVDIEMSRRCRVFVRALDANGIALKTSRLAVLRNGALDVARTDTKVGDDWFAVELSPGSWTVIAEDSGAFGGLLVPEQCDGFRATVPLEPVSQ